MSSKTKTTATKEDARFALVPKLRFPEFRDAKGWHSGPLKNSLSSISNGLALEQGSGTSGYRVTRIETISAGTIDLAKVGSIQTSEDISAYKLRVGDILLSNINSVAHIGKSVFVDRDYDLYHGMNLLRLEVNRNQHDPKFIFYAINTDWIRASFRERANKAVNQASINQTDLGKTEVSLPLRPEQQKIAECLSSVDELIAAQARKVDALKTHKKGLMQQLFPVEGETVPKLRFPEFRDAGEWEAKKLGSLVEIFSGDAPSTHKLSSDHCCPYVKVEDMNNCSKYQSTSREYAEISTSSLPVGAVLFPKRGAAIMRNKVRIAAIPFYIDSNMMALFPHKTSRLSQEFLYYLIITQQLSKIADTSSIPQINNKHIIAQDVVIPSLSEQQKIADCLSSLDELIAAQSQKLDMLKVHKKGLMQQLFPSPEEVEA